MTGDNKPSRGSKVEDRFVMGLNNFRVGVDSRNSVIDLLRFLGGEMGWINRGQAILRTGRN